MSKDLVVARRLRILAALATVALGVSLADARRASAQRDRPSPPATMAWQTTVTPAGEPGEPLVVSGTVFAADGTTPVPNAVVYAYQTDARGLYTPDGRPGVPRLHGWMRTDEAGRYEFRTIRPASYPGQTVPAHIHMIVNAGGREHTVEDIHFQGDPLLRGGAERSAATERFSALCPPHAGAGVARCTRNIRLPE
jgi:protocatechuate 3,4-dioxygenase beta subunit